MVVIAISDFTYNWYYTIVPNTAHTELINAYKPVWVMIYMNMIYHRLSNFVYEIIINQLI